jgi:hypothetical protein
MIKWITEFASETDRIADIVVLITCCALVIWFLLIRASHVLGRYGKAEDAWMEDHIQEATTPTGRSDGR